MAAALEIAASQSTVVPCCCSNAPEIMISSSSNLTARPNDIATVRAARTSYLTRAGEAGQHEIGGLHGLCAVEALLKQPSTLSVRLNQATAGQSARSVLREHKRVCGNGVVSVCVRVCVRT